MKIIIALGLVFIFSIICNASQYAIYNELSDGTRYTFEVSTGAPDHWNSEKDENPPLSAKKEKDIATKFMETIPSHKDFIGWEVDNISLNLMSKGENKEEEWIYDILFTGKTKPVGVYMYMFPRFNVMVRLDGSIPKPKIENNK